VSGQMRDKIVKEGGGLNIYAQSFRKRRKEGKQKTARSGGYISKGSQEKRKSAKKRPTFRLKMFDFNMQVRVAKGEKGRIYPGHNKTP